METLAELAARSDGLEPSGLIFHSSRCGSTLLAQMLGHLDSALIMSEPPVIDQILRPRTELPVADRDTIEWLRWTTSALGQSRRPTQTHLIVKLDAWAILQWPVIQRAFPTTPAIFLYRNPEEVIVSHLGRRGYHMIPGTLSEELVGLTPLEAPELSPEEYCATVLHRIFAAGLDAARQGALQLVNYDSLLAAATDTVAPAFGFDVGPSPRAVFADVATRDAKNPSLEFTATRGGTGPPSTTAVRTAVAGRLTAVYQALEEKRREMS
jgi:hypothetical protein